MNNHGWVGVDFDGTLAQHVGGIDLGPPIPAMVERVKRWLEEGRDVRIVTARAAPVGRSEAHVRQDIERIWVWCERHLGRRLPVTCMKDFAMSVLWDDRAVQVNSLTGDPVAPAEAYPK